MRLKVFERDDWKCQNPDCREWGKIRSFTFITNATIPTVNRGNIRSLISSVTARSVMNMLMLPAIHGSATRQLMF